jgi:hypothetical protein
MYFLTCVRVVSASGSSSYIIPFETLDLPCRIAVLRTIRFQVKFKLVTCLYYTLVEAENLRAQTLMIEPVHLDLCGRGRRPERAGQ